jgi:hypothetical protein
VGKGHDKKGKKPKIGAEEDTAALAAAPRDDGFLRDGHGEDEEAVEVGGFVIVATASEGAWRASFEPSRRGFGGGGEGEAGGFGMILLCFTTF